MERVRHVNRIKGLLFAQGVGDYEPLRADRRARLDELVTGDGRPLPRHVRREIERELDRLEMVVGQIKQVEAERDALLEPRSDAAGEADTGPRLIQLRGIGPEFAGVLHAEAFFRSFSNRRQVAAYAGWPHHRGKAAAWTGSRACPRRATSGCERP